MPGQSWSASTLNGSTRKTSLFGWKIRSPLILDGQGPATQIFEGCQNEGLEGRAEQGTTAAGRRAADPRRDLLGDDSQPGGRPPGDCPSLLRGLSSPRSGGRVSGPGGLPVLRHRVWLLCLGPALPRGPTSGAPRVPGDPGGAAARRVD